MRSLRWIRAFTVLALATPASLRADTPAFVRGDVNSDGVVDIADPVASLWFAFLGDNPISCLRAADADGDGQAAQIADAIYSLRYLFLGSAAPPAPFPTCGTAGDAGPSCESSAFCGHDEEPECRVGVVIAVSPANLSLGVAFDAVVEVVFADSIDPASVRATAGNDLGTVRLLDLHTGRDVAPGGLEAAGPTLRFTPDALLAADATYALLVSSEVVDFCDAALETAAITVFSTALGGRTEALVSHPQPGRFSQALDDVAWDIDWTQSVDLDWLRSSVEGAEAAAAARNVVATSVDGIPETVTNEAPGTIRYTRFHFWPNIIDLSEVNGRDPSLYARMVADLLASEPGRAVLAAELEAEIGRGDRVFLARDFIDSVHYELAVYTEVHYGLLINLDAKTAREPLVHRFAAAGLPPLHDPRVDVLRALFANTAEAPFGEIWDLCLRGNFLRRRNSINVDKLDGLPNTELFIGRVDRACSGPGAGPPPDDGDDDDDPPGDPPPPGGGGDGTGEGQRSARVPSPARPPAPPEGEGNDARNPGGACPTPAEEAALRTKQQELEVCKDGLRDERAEDIAAVNNTVHGWGPATFHDPSLAALHAEYDARIKTVEAQLAALNAQCMQAVAAETAAKTGAPAPVRAAKERSDWWDDMIFRGGAWQEVGVPCFELLIFARIDLPPAFLLDLQRLRVNFNMAVHRGISRDGLSFDEAVKAALADPSVYPQGHEQAKEIQLFWYSYSKCLKRLHVEMMKKWLDRYFPDATPEERDRAIAILLDGASAATLAEKSACDDLQSQLAVLQAARDTLEAQKAALRAEHERLRAEFRQRALAESFPASLEELKQKILELAVLRGFFGFCDELRRNPGNPDPAAGTVHHGFSNQEFCRLLGELIARLRQMQQQGQPVSQAYLMYLEGFFHPGGACAQPG